MSPNGSTFAASGARSSSGGGLERARPDVADAAVLAGIAPRPAERTVEHLDRLAFGQLGQLLGILTPVGKQRGGLGEVAQQRLGIVRGDDLPRERDVGEVLAIGGVGGVGQV